MLGLRFFFMYIKHNSTVQGGTVDAGLSCIGSTFPERAGSYIRRTTTNKIIYKQENPKLLHTNVTK